jgi:2-polyprenyl-3-methyl-5-hydroxy-6-metoxy-1,4-benzoquinol methylase
MEAFMSAQFTSPLDQAKSEAFAEHMLGVLNSGALSLMLSIGHKTGLFDTLSHLALSTSEHIAAAAGLQERYVREWLAAMVTGRLIEYDAANLEVADIGCGSGHAINLMAQAFPHSRFVGYDISQEGIGAAQAEAKRLGVTTTRFEVQDVSQLDTPGRYDLITAFDAIHDQAKPTQVLAALAMALRPWGMFLMVDFAASSQLEENLGHPLAALTKTRSHRH